MKKRIIITAICGFLRGTKRNWRDKMKGKERICCAFIFFLAIFFVPCISDVEATDPDSTFGDAAFGRTDESEEERIRKAPKMPKRQKPSLADDAFGDAAAGKFDDVEEEKEEKEEEEAKEVVERPPFQMPYNPNIPTKRIMVSSFENGVPALSAHLNIETALTAQLTTTLSKCKNFSVLDRSALAVLKDELTLSAAGAVTKQTTATPGKVLGVQAIIKGVITEFAEEVKGSASGSKVGIGSAAKVVGVFTDSKIADVVAAINPEIGGGDETVTGKVGLDIRLIDVNTGIVIASVNANGKLTREKSSSVLGIAGFSTMSETFENTVIGEATRLAIQDAVIKIFELMKKIPWKGLVAAVRPGGLIIINAGANQNLHEGQIMSIEAEGEKITDPATGLVLFVESKKIAEIRIMSVKDNVSFAQMLKGGNVKRGDVVCLK